MSRVARSPSSTGRRPASPRRSRPAARRIQLDRLHPSPGGADGRRPHRRLVSDVRRRRDPVQRHLLLPVHADRRFPAPRRLDRRGVAAPCGLAAGTTYAQGRRPWLRGIPTGKSFGNVCGATVTQNLTQALGHTAALLAMTFVLVVIFSLVFGVLAAARAGGWLDSGFRVFSYTAWAVPPFLLALVLQSVVIWLGTTWDFHFFPASGWPGACIFGVVGCENPVAPHGWDYAGEVLRFLV